MKDHHETPLFGKRIMIGIFKKKVEYARVANAGKTPSFTK
jgi:hypothetical protein